MVWKIVDAVLIGFWVCGCLVFGMEAEKNGFQMTPLIIGMCASLVLLEAIAFKFANSPLKFSLGVDHEDPFLISELYVHWFTVLIILAPAIYLKAGAFLWIFGAVVFKNIPRFCVQLFINRPVKYIA